MTRAKPESVDVIKTASAGAQILDIAGIKIKEDVARKMVADGLDNQLLSPILKEAYSRGGEDEVRDLVDDLEMRIVGLGLQLVLKFEFAMVDLKAQNLPHEAHLVLKDRNGWVLDIVSIILGGD